MAEGSGPPAPRKGPLLNIQLLRAQYEGLRRKQRAQAHVVVLPKGRAGQVLGAEDLDVGRMGGRAVGSAGPGLCGPSRWTNAGRQGQNRGAGLGAS